jgi:uncharacterized FlgJ-related protein
MKKQLSIAVSFFIVQANILCAQPSQAIADYIQNYKQIAIIEMHRTGVPAAIKLAQGIHETDAGNSELVKKSNNHFGIKCKTGWTGGKVYHTDDAVEATTLLKNLIKIIPIFYAIAIDMLFCLN